MDKSLQIAGVSIVSAAAGLIIGYKVAEKRLAAQFEERLETETSEMKTFFEQVKKPYATPEEAVADLIPEPAQIVDPREKAQKVQYNKIVKVYEGDDEEQGAAAAEEEIVASNIFQPKVLPNPDPTKPYVISQEVFMLGEPEFDQVTLTYYLEGATLTDEREDILDDPINTVGDAFVNSFGSFSSDDNTVHVRNERIGIDFEIVKTESSYRKDVLGEED